MPTGLMSTIATEAPRRDSSYATAHPTIPAPTTMMSEGRVMPTTGPNLVLRLAVRCATGRRSHLAGIEMFTIHDRVEAKHVGPLCLPPPERPDREHHDVTFAEW